MKTPAELDASPDEPPVDIRDLIYQIERRGIPITRLARRLGMNQSHLRRVLTGERPATETLLRSLAEFLEDKRGRHIQEDTARLIGAAVHVFFLKRGRRQSEIWRPPFQYRPLEKGSRP